MKLTLIGTDRRFDVESLCTMFYPREGFSEEKGKSLTICMKDNTFIAEFTCDKGVFHEKEKIKPLLYDAERTALKTIVYKILSRASGGFSPWGILSGVHPISFYKKTKNIYGDKTDKIMKDEYLVNEEKIELCETVEIRQRDIIQDDLEKTASIYISIPFCPTRCKYCSFVSEVTDRERGLISEYLNCLDIEMQEKALKIKEDGKLITDIYIGGGTPTVLAENELYHLLSRINFHFGNNFKEYTVEAGRPDTITRQKLSIMKQFGVSRVSVNPQTLDDRILDIIGRKHTVKDFYNAYLQALDIGFIINVDLIAGLPCETAEGFAAGFNNIISLAPQNITLHTLYIKRAADYGSFDMNNFTSKALEVGLMLSSAQQSCKNNSYLPYYLYRQKNTIGNHENVGYSIAGSECRYNILMMDDMQTVYGIGAGAMTKTKNGEIMKRHCNTKFAYNYIKEIYDSKKL